MSKTQLAKYTVYANCTNVAANHLAKCSSSTCCEWICKTVKIHNAFQLHLQNVCCRRTSEKNMYFAFYCCWSLRVNKADICVSYKYFSLLLTQHTCMERDICHHCTVSAAPDSPASNFDWAPNYQIAVPWAADKCLCRKIKVCFIWKIVFNFVYTKLSFTFFQQMLQSHCWNCFQSPCFLRKWYCCLGSLLVIASFWGLWWGSIKKVTHGAGEETNSRKL